MNKFFKGFLHFTGLATVFSALTVTSVMGKEPSSKDFDTSNMGLAVCATKAFKANSAQYHRADYNPVDGEIQGSNYWLENGELYAKTMVSVGAFDYADLDGNPKPAPDGTVSAFMITQSHPTEDTSFSIGFDLDRMGEIKNLRAIADTDEGGVDFPINKDISFSEQFNRFFVDVKNNREAFSDISAAPIAGTWGMWKVMKDCYQYKI